MTIKDFEQEQATLLEDTEVPVAWLEYLSRFPYQSAYFRAASQYEFRVRPIADKRTGSDINYYKLFAEQCFNLLRPSGQCGIVLATDIYTDIGATGLRKMLFDTARFEPFCLYPMDAFSLKALIIDLSMSSSPLKKVARPTNLRRLSYRPA